MYSSKLDLSSYDAEYKKFVDNYPEGPIRNYIPSKLYFALIEASKCINNFPFIKQIVSNIFSEQEIANFCPVFFMRAIINACVWPDCYSMACYMWESSPKNAKTEMRELYISMYSQETPNPSFHKLLL